MLSVQFQPRLQAKSMLQSNQIVFFRTLRSCYIRETIRSQCFDSMIYNMPSIVMIVIAVVVVSVFVAVAVMFVLVPMLVFMSVLMMTIFVVMG